jgi:hypothetical protein
LGIFKINLLVKKPGILLVFSFEINAPKIESLSSSTTMGSKRVSMVGFWNQKITNNSGVAIFYHHFNDFGPSYKCPPTSKDLKQGSNINATML